MTWHQWAEYWFAEEEKLAAKYPEWIELTRSGNLWRRFSDLDTQTEDPADEAAYQFAYDGQWPELDPACGAMIRLRLYQAAIYAKELQFLQSSGLLHAPSDHPESDLKKWFLVEAWDQILCARIYVNLEFLQRVHILDIPPITGDADGHRSGPA